MVYNVDIMVAARQELRSVGETTNERCIPMEDAINEGQRYDGVFLSLAALHLLQANPDLMGANARVGDQVIVVDHFGCIPEHERTETTTRLVVTPCPEDVAKHCGNCVLSHACGSELVGVLKPFEPLMKHSTSF